LAYILNCVGSECVP